MISIIIPASNEESLIGSCLSALATATPVAAPVEVIVVANGCRDATVARAKAYREALEGRRWRFVVLDLPVGDKIGALNAGDRVAQGRARVYLDADVTVSPDLLGQLADALDRPDPVYASGSLRITAPGTWASRAYARIWRQVPFMARGVPGCGLFAVNAAGRARWGAFPQVIADDTYVRLMFAPAERVLVPASYDWPIADGFTALVRVRRRQDAGVAEIAARFPEIMKNEDKGQLGLRGLMSLALCAPLSFAVYAAVALKVRSAAPSAEWSRGR